MADFEAQRKMMVDTQVRPSDVTHYPVLQAMLAVPKEAYVPDAMRDVAYQDNPIVLDRSAIILDARLFAKMVQELSITPEDVVLDLGCAHGYSTAVLSKMAQFVVGVEADEARADEAQATLSSHNIDNAAILSGPLNEGAAKSAPYSAIIIEGGVETLPEALLDQLADGGRIAVIFMEGALGTVRIGQKIVGRVSWREAFNGSAQILEGFEKATVFEF